MRKTVSFVTLLLFMIATLVACSPSQPAPVGSDPETQGAANSAPSSTSETVTSEPNDPINSNIFTTDTVTLNAVDYRAGDRVRKLVDAGWTLEADSEYSFEQAVDSLDILYLNLDLEHADYPGTSLHVAVDLFDNKPEDVLADGYIVSFHLIFDIYDKDGNAPWSIGGTLNDTLSLEDVITKFDGSTADEGTPGYTKIVDLEDYCENSGFSKIELEWDLDEDLFEYVTVKFNLDD